MSVPSHEAEGMLNDEEIEIDTVFEELTFNEGENDECNSEGEDEVYADNEAEGDTEGLYEETSEQLSEDIDAEQSIMINGMVDILNIDMKNISLDEVGRYDFSDLEVAYQFYCWFGRVNGFSVRKGQVIRNSMDQILQQTFLCSRQGYRENRGLTLERRRRVPKHETRCGCLAKFRVHFDIHTQRWYVSVFNFNHNHGLLEEKYCALLPSHRKMSTADILQIENFRKVGIRLPHMYGASANTAGGYDKIGFVKRVIYNQVGKQKRQISSDASGALKYLRDLAFKDPQMFVRYTTDDGGRSKHLFWCDGDSRMNYQIFGDVVAFDATYRKNKYMCPFVVFSGVNHHNQTIVFATALVSNETEETYVWLLEEFLFAMHGKAPISVITDGDVAMKNAIHGVFPNAHHRLCAWHLLHNAMTNVGVPDFMAYFKKCMLGDFEVARSEDIWTAMVGKFGLEDNNWIRELYEKRKMWSTAHIRGNFFAGIRTTSRCEALHSHIGKFVHSRISLTEFVQQFQRCLTYFRFREVEADFQSEYGQAILQTTLRSLEQSASKQFTKEIFYLFRPTLTKASLIRVMECQDMALYSIYSVAKYRAEGSIWQVSYCPSLVELRCSCLRMESIGLPCDHIVRVLVYLDFTELPKCLVLDRWTKTAKDSIGGSNDQGSGYWNSQNIARYATLVQLSKEVSELAHRDVDEYHQLVDFLTSELCRLKSKYGPPPSDVNMTSQTQVESLLDPPVVRTKGCDPSTTTIEGRRRRSQSCSTCGASGHNKRSCPRVRQSGLGGGGSGVPSMSADDTHDFPNDLYNDQMYEEQSEAFIPSTSGVAMEADLCEP